MLINPYNATPAQIQQEQSLIALAQKGDTQAQQQLYAHYEDNIKRYHKYSATGQYPELFGRSFNPKGYKYEDYMGELYLVHMDSIRLYDPLHCCVKAKLPFLKFLKDNINHNALSDVRNNSKRAKREILPKQPTHPDEEPPKEYASAPDTQKQKDVELKKLTQQVMKDCKKNKKVHDYLQTYLQFAKTHHKQHGINTALAKQTNTKRGNNDYAKTLALQYIPKKRLTQFRNIMQLGD